MSATPFPLRRYTPEEIQRLDINVCQILRKRQAVTGEALADHLIGSASRQAYRQFRHYPETEGIKRQRMEQEIFLLRQALRRVCHELADVVEPVGTDHRAPEERASDWADLRAEIDADDIRTGVTA